ncbi:hypothetical protein Pmar_PMAR020073 [Perkinsus marinus ATCC 50983]|uniref:Uncharacterized protein n=1 Tax=Perkinsus marinus (strain ATCC 50983 / TXsc) TaxID=423536 RepID=C5KWL9_PERM5|nr:hypothetical protein Pmar_PMAR020073 [Perkinsus marinus ATCC 50983]EER11094.1 hypothetical protein Pmar_PMAR020073 [Perkinsus marinus ATCC 50983]|eukprot:XP_002779299.1 hypothetical protein Pmar_PMAR020073 [Perkinsus marinus ATCC 50983]
MESSELKGSGNTQETRTTGLLSRGASSEGLSRAESGTSRPQVMALTPEPEEPVKIAAELKRPPLAGALPGSEPPALENGEQLAIVSRKEETMVVASKLTKSVSSASFESALSGDEGSSSSDEKRLRSISTDKLVKELSKRMVGEEEAARKAPDPIAQVQRLRTFYGFRKRVNTYTDLTHHPNDLWWSEAHNDCAKIANDLGPSPQLLSEVIKVRVVRRPKEELDSDMSYFSDYVSMGMANPEKRYFVFKLGLGDHIVVTLSEVIDDEAYERLFTQYTPTQMLMERMKFITCPANLVVPVPLLGPKSAQTLGVYFGLNNVSCQYCSTPLPGGDALRFVSVYIDIYSKWILRKTIPSLAFTVGRISDFFLVDYEKAIIYSSFRLVCTEEGVALMNK